MFFRTFASPSSLTSRNSSISPPGSLYKSSIPIFPTFQCWFSVEISCSMFYLGHLCHFDVKPLLIFKARKSTHKPIASLGLLSTISMLPYTSKQCLSSITALAKIWWAHGPITFVLFMISVRIVVFLIYWSCWLRLWGSEVKVIRTWLYRVRRLQCDKAADKIGTESPAYFIWKSS